MIALLRCVILSFHILCCLIQGLNPLQVPALYSSGSWANLLFFAQVSWLPFSVYILTRATSPWEFWLASTWSVHLLGKSNYYIICNTDSLTLFLQCHLLLWRALLPGLHHKISDRVPGKLMVGDGLIHIYLSFRFDYKNNNIHRKLNLLNLSRQMITLDMIINVWVSSNVESSHAVGSTLCCVKGCAPMNIYFHTPCWSRSTLIRV